MKFIHAADVHIDSPLRGLEAYEGAPVEQVRAATREAFSKVVEHAIDHCVDFVIIAGDLFDGDWRDMKTGLWTASQFRRLQRENIRVHLIRGNHDAASRVEKSLTWPANVHEFSTERPETVHLADLEVALHGQGFASQTVNEDLAAQFPPAVPDAFNIGVLHTSLAGDPQHDSYAPTSEKVLCASGYDYWALGHIHQRREIRKESPAIVYSGNTQGRHIKEQGEKGCYLVTVEDRQIAAMTFLPTDCLRWRQIDVCLEKTDLLADLYGNVREAIETVLQESDGLPAAVRIVASGPCEAHRDLATSAGRQEACAEIRNLAGEFGEQVWIEKIKLQTAPAIDPDQLRRSHDMVGELVRMIDDVAADEDELIKLAQSLEAVEERAAARLQQAVDFKDPEQLRSWVESAQNLLLADLCVEPT